MWAKSLIKAVSTRKFAFVKLIEILKGVTMLNFPKHPFKLGRCLADTEKKFSILINFSENETFNTNCFYYLILLPKLHRACMHTDQRGHGLVLSTQQEKTTAVCTTQLNFSKIARW